MLTGPKLLTSNNLITLYFRYHEVPIRSQLLLTLRFYATGSFYITIGDFSGVYKTTAGRIIKKITDIILSLGPRYIKFPGNQDERNVVQTNFYRLARFPKVIGALDCTHIPIQSPGIFMNINKFTYVHLYINMYPIKKFIIYIFRW